jgi:hypothetical protein
VIVPKHQFPVEPVPARHYAIVVLTSNASECVDFVRRHSSKVTIEFGVDGALLHFLDDDGPSLPVTYGEVLISDTGAATTNLRFSVVPQEDIDNVKTWRVLGPGPHWPDDE